MVTELSGFNIMIIGGQSGFDLCFALPDKERFKDLPPVTFHSRDADMKLNPEATYAIGVTGSGQQYFCLAMLPIDFRGLMIIGAFQQTNQRFIFDTSESKLYFGPEDCTRSGV
ncbi:hypothetical protein L1049_004952 [Liquidambar formosana]|uniref:Xylanase inhibitor C-terminal domain-containing protein n=1 Tax=Liquidambar formosana TaxID=63359 RepID=A0AAP0X0X3_LIQFO